MFLFPAIFTMSAVMYIYIRNTQNLRDRIGASICSLNFHVFHQVKHPGEPYIFLSRYLNEHIEPFTLTAFQFTKNGVSQFGGSFYYFHLLYWVTYIGACCTCYPFHLSLFSRLNLASLLQAKPEFILSPSSLKIF